MQPYLQSYHDPSRKPLAHFIYPIPRHQYLKVTQPKCAREGHRDAALALPCATIGGVRKRAEVKRLEDMGLNLLARYGRWMARYPHVSNMTSGAAVMVVGDSASQYIETGSFRTFDPVRACIMSSYASLFVSPYCVKLYGYLGKR